MNATPERTADIAKGLAARWPDVRVELDHQNAYQLLVATILAAQSTDKLINTVTPVLFAKYPDPGALAQANQAELEPMIFKTGFYRMKAKHIIGMAQAVVRDHGGQVPDTMEALCSLPGVARKTANVVLGNALDKHVGIVVDTHVTRVSARLGLTTNTDPVKIEQDLTRLVPQDEWTRFGNRMIHHGRYICLGKVPDCEHCALAPICPSSLVGRDPGKPPSLGKPPKVAKAAVKLVGAAVAKAATKLRAVAKPRPRA